MMMKIQCARKKLNTQSDDTQIQIIVKLIELNIVNGPESR